MPKSIFIDPKEVRKSQILKINDIPINQYKPDIKKEVKKYGEEKLLKIYYDMLIIREFESMLNSIKIQGSYEGIEYNHLGPAHLSIGQESSAVGQCVHLSIEDFIFGSHRSHGEILAKCFSAIDELEENELLKIMKSYMDGACLKAVEKEHKGNIKLLAQDFVLYGVLAEIFGRANGFNKGLGGSMHVFFAPFGSMPNNAIVGGAADISVGAALFKRINRKPGMVICNIGDGSMGCGPVWEAIMLASMDQYRTLWDKDIGGAPPILFNFFNNFYGMGGQTSGETMGYKILARVGAGVNPENLHAERVDGYNPLAVADAIERKKKILLQGNGPVLLDTITYRISGHSPSDASSYRSKEEISAWQEADCIKGYEDYLKKNRIITSSKVDSLKHEAILRITKALKLTASLEISPRVKADFIESVMFSHQYKDRMEQRTPEVLIPKEDNPRVKSLTHKYRFALDENSKAYPKVKVFTYRDALFEAMLYRFYEDPTMVAYGEENRDWDGAFAVYRGLTEALPYHRLFNTPISEGAIVGSGAGYALSGGRVVVELMYSDFIGRAGDELFNQVSKWQSMSAGLLTMPLTIRVSVGNKYGAQHSQDWTSLLAHIPGLKVMFPATPYDAKGMLNLALHGTDPVVFFESQKLYDIGELFVSTGVPEDYYEVPEGEPIIRKEGKDITILAVGAALYKGLEAAEELEKKYKVSAEVIDLRFINPLNYELIIKSVKKTGKLVLVSDACERGSFLHTIASNIAQFVFDYLDGPVVIVGSRNWITEEALETKEYPEIEKAPDTEITLETEEALETKEYPEIEKASIGLNLDVGKLTLGESTPLLYECISQYRYKEFEPFEKFSHAEKEADIIIYHSPITKKRISNNIKNNWQLKLNNKIIYNLSIKTGAIDTDCNLSGFKIETLYIKSGASNINLIIPQYDSKIIIDSGVSNIEITIPKNVGATVNIDSGIAVKDLDIDDFIKKDGRYISNNYDYSEFKTEIEIDCGVSNIEVNYINIP